MSVFQLDLDLLEAAKDEYIKSAEALGADIETSNTVVSNTTTEVYEGEDGEVFRSGFGNFVNKDFTDIGDTVKSIGTALESGLEEGKKCKKICNDFLYTLEGTASGTTVEEMKGILYCDQSIITELKGFCSTALEHNEAVRLGSLELDSILGKLQMVSLNAGQYTEIIREGCKKVERLEDHSAELTTYATAAEDADSGLNSYLSLCMPLGYLDAILAADLLSPQARQVLDTINKPEGEWTEEDRENLEKNLWILTENGEITELEKIAGAIVASENDVTHTEVGYCVMGILLDYAERNGNKEILDTLYTSMLKTEMAGIQADTHTNTTFTTYTYELSFDSEIVSGILGYLDPEENGLAYYSLQRRSKYAGTDEVTVIGIYPEALEAEFEITFEEVEGKMVSVIAFGEEKAKLSSVDMNEIVGEEGKAIMKNEKGFSDEQIVLFMSSIYTDEDVDLIEGIAWARTEEEYAQATDILPEKLGPAIPGTLYAYAYKLVEDAIKCQEPYEAPYEVVGGEYEPLQTFINGILYNSNYAPEYTKMISDTGKVCIRGQEYLFSQAYNNPEYIDEVTVNSAYNCHTIKLFQYLNNSCTEYEVGYHYMKVDELKFQGDLLDGGFIYDQMTFIDKNGEPYCVVIEDDIFDRYHRHEENVVTLIGNEIAMEKVSNDYIKSQETVDKVLFDMVYNCSTDLISSVSPLFGGGLQLGKAIMEGGNVLSEGMDMGKTLNSEYMGNNKVTDGILSFTGTICSGYADYMKAKEEMQYDKAVFEACMNGCAIKDGEKIIALGTYDPRVQMKMAAYYEDGISFMIDGEKASNMKLVIEESIKNPDEDYIVRESIRDVVCSLETPLSTDDVEEMKRNMYVIFSGEKQDIELGLEDTSIEDIPIEDVKEYMNMLDKIYKRKYEETESILSWQAFTNYDMYSNYDFEEHKTK